MTMSRKSRKLGSAFHLSTRDAKLSPLSRDWLTVKVTDESLTSYEESAGEV